MKPKLIRPEVTSLEDRLAPAGLPQMETWLKQTPGEYATVVSGYNVSAGASATWPTNVPTGTKYSGGNTTATLGDTQKISYSGSYVYVQSPDFSSSVMGPWFNANSSTFQNFPSNQNRIMRFPRNPTPATGTHTTAGLGAIGLLANGISLFNALDAFSYSHASGTDSMTGDGYWNRDAKVGEAVTFDHGHTHQPQNGENHAHISPTALRAQLRDNIAYHGSLSNYPYESANIVVSSESGTDLYTEYTTARHHSPILGYAFDGYPIYGPYGYSDGTNINSDIVQMSSSYRLRNIATRTSMPGWAAKVKFGDSVTLNAAGEYPLATSVQGPNVSTTYPLGYYIEDYEFVSGLGTLDVYNGRFTKTPEYPNGTYAYFVSLDSSGEDVYPYAIGRQYYGTTSGGRVTSITESVTTYFDVTSPQTGGTVRGLAYFDQNGNAARDAGELGWSNVTMYVDANNNGTRDSGESSAVTTADGNYELTLAANGSATIRMDTPVGYVRTTTNPAAFNVTGGNPINGVVFGLRVLPPTVSTFQVNDGSAQRSRVTSVSVTFSGSVSFPNGVANAFTVARTSGGTAGTVAFNAVQSGNTATLTFANGGTIGLEGSGSLPDGSYTLTVIAANISGSGGLLDGDGNGSGGDNATRVFHRLFGDADGTGSVDANDFPSFGNVMNCAIPNSPFDINGDGFIETTDFVEFGGRFNTTL